MLPSSPTRSAALSGGIAFARFIVKHTVRYVKKTLQRVERELATAANRTGLNTVLNPLYRFPWDPRPHLEHDQPFIRALGRHGLHLQARLHIPEAWAFFTPGENRVLAMEACYMANLLFTMLLVLVFVSYCWYQGGHAVFPVRLWCLVALACTSTYVEARRYRDLVPLSWQDLAMVNEQSVSLSGEESSSLSDEEPIALLP